MPCDTNRRTRHAAMQKLFNDPAINCLRRSALRCAALESPYHGGACNPRKTPYCLNFHGYRTTLNGQWLFVLRCSDCVCVEG